MLRLYESGFKTCLDASDVSSSVWMHPGCYSRSDTPQPDQPHTTHPNADGAKTRPDACKQATKYQMRPNASTNRAQIHLTDAFGRIRCFILDASRSGFL